MVGQSDLEELWLGGHGGSLCALEQAKVWALREVWRADGKVNYGMCAFIATKVLKNDGKHPTRQAVRQLLERIDNDKAWFPGKQYGEKRGRKRVLTGAKASALCRSAKRIKRSGGEVTYPLLCARARKAVRNPTTGQPLAKHAVYECLRTYCYDKSPDKPWGNRRRRGRTALTADMVARRLVWARYMEGLAHPADWYFQNVVWVDICCSLLPTTAAKAAEQALARKGNKVWCSEDALSDDENLRGDVRALKMNSWDTKRVFWVPVLCRGKLHIGQLPDDFPGDKPAGAPAFVKAVRAALNVRFPEGDLPRVIFTDRGAGFYNPGTGRITNEYRAALATHGLQAFMGESAAVQPGKLSELMLHETAVSWIRVLLSSTLPARPWDESPPQLISRLKRVAGIINAEHDVAGLCRALPARIAELVRRGGGKLAR